MSEPALPIGLEGVTDQLARELAGVAEADSYRYAAVVRLAAAARERGMDRDLAVRRALDVTAAEDEGFDARLAKRLEETLADPTPGIPLEEFLRAHDI